MAPALEVILTGDPLSAERAHQLGMVNAVAPREQVMAEARKLAERIIANAPLAVQASRAIAVRAFLDDDEALWKASAKGMADMAQTEDYKEGPKAFIEKRAPNWQGR